MGIDIFTLNVKKSRHVNIRRKQLDVAEIAEYIVRKFLFSQRITNGWRELSVYCVDASCVKMFKNRNDNYLV